MIGRKNYVVMKCQMLEMSLATTETLHVSEQRNTSNMSQTNQTNDWLTGDALEISYDLKHFECN